MPPSLQTQVDTLEKEVEALRKENESIRSELRSPRAKGDDALTVLRDQVEHMSDMLPVLSVPAFTVRETSGGGNGHKEVPIYEVRVNNGEMEYSLFRRYSSFRTLHERIEVRFKNDENLPQFPGRQFLFKSTNNDKAAINKRRQDLQTYIRQLIASDTVRRCDSVRSFFAPAGAGKTSSGDSGAVSNED